MGAKSTGLKDLIDDLDDAAERAPEALKKVVGQGLNNIKREAQRIIRANSPHGYLPHYPRAISYEVTAKGPVVSGEVGPRRDRKQGGLGSYIEFGTVNNAPIPHMVPATDAEEPRFIRYVEDLGVKLLEGEPVAGGPVVDPT
jgi:hypothetical protein